MVTKKGMVILLITIFILQSISAADVGYITKRYTDEKVMQVFNDMDLTVDVIKDSDVKRKDLSSYKFLFIDDGILRNTGKIPIYNYPSIIMNKEYGFEWGLTDVDGISQIGSTAPLKVKIDSRVAQVYTVAQEGTAAIPYYYLDDENKANFTSLARTYIGNTLYDFGDVVSTADKGTHLVNGKVSKGKMCFFGIAKTEFWTQNAEDLFEECVGFVSGVCRTDAECNDNHENTEDICENPGTPDAECVNYPIECLRGSDCGADGFIGNNFCSGNDVKRNFIDYTCENPGTRNSSCSSESENRLIQQCTTTQMCTDGQCITKPQCSDGIDNDNDGLIDMADPGCQNPQDNDETNLPITCSKNLDCGTDGFIGNNYCSVNGDAVRDFKTFTCSNPGTTQSSCSNNISAKLIDDCSASETCSNGQCIQISCSKNSDCGKDGYVSEAYCSSEGDVKRDYRTFKCSNPGTSQSSCSSNTEQRLIDDCVGDEICIGRQQNSLLTGIPKTSSSEEARCVKIRCNGDSQCNDNNPMTIDQCVNPGTPESSCRNTPINCIRNSDCGFTGFLGNEFCSSNRENIVKTYQNATCNNPGSANSFCQINREDRVVQNCNDNNQNTIDSCKNETQPICIHEPNIPIACNTKLDCGVDGFIGNNYCSVNGDAVRDFKTFTCNNPGSVNSFCSSNTEQRLIDDCLINEMCTNGQCITKPQCSDEIDNDGDGLIDMQDPGCQNPQDNDEGDEVIECRNEGDCGTDGFIGNNFCSGNDVKRNFIDYTCNNPGSVNSFCLSNTEQRLIDDCLINEMCTNGQCIEIPDIECNDDDDCDDNNQRTVDRCINPGTTQSFCRNTEVNCLNNLDCGVTSFIGDEFCWNNDIYKAFQTSTCVNPGTLVSYCNIEATPQLVQDCNDNNPGTIDQCSKIPGDGAICKHIPIGECRNEGDCGTDGFIGNNFCSGNNVKRNFIDYTCNNPGSVNSFCSSTTNSRLVQQCTASQICQNGQCVNQNIACYTKADCGVDGFIGNNYCSVNGDAVRDFKTFTCNNPGSANSFCSSNTEQRLIDDCLINEMCTNGQCIAKPQCSDGIDNDNDGLIDMQDPGCQNPQDNDETDAVCVYDPSKTYDCEVTQGTNQVLYWGNNNEWMCNRYGGNFQEKHIICYNNQWYEASPTWNWNPWNGDFIPFENVITPCTQVGSWYVDAADGVWKKGQVPANCPLMAACKEVDFNCNNVIDQGDTTEITNVFNDLTSNNKGITPQYINQKQCSVMKSSLGLIMFREVDKGASKAVMTLADLNERKNKINQCISKQ